MTNYLGNVEGNATIFERTIDTAKGKFKVHNIAISKKNEDGSYSNASLDVVFSKKALEAFNKVKGTVTKNGATMKKVCCRGWLTVKTRNDKSFVAMFINELVDIAPNFEEVAEDEDIPF